MLNENILKNDEKAIYNLRSLYRRFGYSRFKMSKFEEYDLYVRNKDFLISEAKKAQQGIVTPNCRQKCSACGANCYKGGVCYE